MFLFDTMVISELGRRKPHPRVHSWFSSTRAETLFVSTITFGEIGAGIARSRAIDPIFAERLEQWSLQARKQFEERTLPITTAIALRWGELYARLKRRDLDLLIAATALEHDLTVVTRNVRHFETTGAKFFNPYEPA